MSKIGKQPIEVLQGVTVALQNGEVSVSGGKGNLSFKIPQGIDVKQADGKIIVSQVNPENSEIRNIFGLVRAQIANMVKGVSQGFEKKLELSGVGYRAQVAGDNLTLSVGFSHPVIVKAPTGITFSVNENIITISSFDKSWVGDMAAKIRDIRPPEPYKGKGISYLGEKIRRKAGKAAKTVGATK